MNTQTTVASARAILGGLFRPDDFLPYINQACERVVNSGLWKGTIALTAFPSVNNYFTLPYPYLAVTGAQWFRAPVPVFGQYHEFISAGPGQVIPNLPPQGIVQDIGDGFATMTDPPTAGSTLSITLQSASDAGKIIRFYGISNGKEIFDSSGMGMNVTLAYPTTAISTVFDVVTGIQVPTDTDGSSDMVSGWTLYSVAPDTTQTELSYYYPNETRPCYRRYQIGVTSASNTQVPNAVTVLVRRRFMPVYKETDWVVPGNIGALKFAMQAIDNESAKNPSDALWKQCYDTLNQELHALRGASRPEMNYEVLGSLGGFTSIH